MNVGTSRETSQTAFKLEYFTTFQNKTIRIRSSLSRSSLFYFFGNIFEVSGIKMDETPCIEQTR